MYTIDALTQARQQIDQWIRDGQSVLGRVIPSLFQAIEGLSRRAEAAEDDARRVARELNELQAEATRLREEIEHLKRLRAEMVESVERAVDEIGRVTADLVGRVRESGGKPFG